NVLRPRFDGDARLDTPPRAGNVRRIVRVVDARLRRRRFQARNRHAGVPVRPRRSRTGRHHMTARLRRVLLLKPSDITLLCRAAVILLSIRLSLWMRPWNRFRSPATRTGSLRAMNPGVNRLEWAVLA